MDNIIGMFEEKLRETTHEAHTSLESWLFLYSWEMVSCLGEIKTHLIVGQPQEFHRAPSTPEVLGTGPGRWGWGWFFITLDFDFQSPDSYFSHPFSSLSIFSSIPVPFLPSIPSCFPAHHQSTSDTGSTALDSVPLEALSLTSGV